MIVDKSRAETCTLVKTRTLGIIGYASLDPMAEKQRKNKSTVTDGYRVGSFMVVRNKWRLRNINHYTCGQSWCNLEEKLV